MIVPPVPSCTFAELGLPEVLKLISGSKVPPIVPIDHETRTINARDVASAISLLSTRDE